MNKHIKNRRLLIFSIVTIMVISVFATQLMVSADFELTNITDQTPDAPLTNPIPSSYQPRYLSGFGMDDSFTIFFEDRDAGNAISYVSTTTGPTGFPSSPTATNIADTHFCVKDDPINIGGTDYAYRAWASVGNNMDHKFYVSNDLSTWTLVSTFTIPNAATFTNARGWVYYGFHDVIQLNGMYYAFAESNQGQTMICRSANGDDVWEAFESVGGTQAADGPLQMPESCTPSGSFIDLGYDRGFGKIHVRGNDGGCYLAVNTEATQDKTPAQIEAAFINPNNWNWDDGSTGLPTASASPVLLETTEHDVRECWVVPNSDPSQDWVLVYDADYGSGDGGKALGYASLTPPSAGTVENIDTGELFDWIQDAIDDSDTDNGDIIVVHDPDPVIHPTGAYVEHVVVDKELTLQAGSTPIIDGGGSGNGILIQSGNVVIDGFDVTNCDNAIRTYGGPATYDNVEIKNCNIYHNRVNGILVVFDSMDNLIIRDTSISDTYGSGHNAIGFGNGAVLTNMLIENVDITGAPTSGHGIFANGVTLDTVSLDTVDITNPGNWQGINIENTDVDYLDVVDSTITGSGGFGVVFKGSTDVNQVLFDNSEISNSNGGSGLAFVCPCTGVEITECIFYGNAWEDIDLGVGWMGASSFTDVLVYGCDFSSGPAWAQVYIDGSASPLTNVHINQNNFRAGTGIGNGNTVTVDGTCNWWATTAGPNAGGAGFYGPVTYCPWLDGAYPLGDCVGGAACWNTDTGEYFCSIQKAIDDADTDDGDTIEVFAGTHPGNILVYKEVSIQSETGAANTIIDASVVDYSSYQNSYGNTINYAWSESNDPGLLKNGFMIWSDAVTIDGFKIINAQWTTQYNRGIGILIGSIGTTYAGFIPWNLDQWSGIVPNPDEPTPTGVVIKNNIIVSPSDGIYNWASSGNLFEDNEISVTQPLGGVGIQVYEGGTNNIIRGNEIDNAGDAISIGGAWPDVLLDVSNTEIYENTLTNSVSGIKFYNVAGSGAEAHHNDIMYNGKGIVFDSVGSASVAIAYCNNIEGNSVGVENNAATDTFIATCNWWGDCSGPSGEGSGTGDFVSTNVEFDPWVGSITADAGGPYVAYYDSNYMVQFYSTQTITPGCCDETITGYLWDFGDGETSTEANPYHQYHRTTETSYTVTLTVTTTTLGHSCSNTTTTTVTVDPNPDDSQPIIQLSYPEGGEILSGTVTVKWYAIDEDYPAGSINLPIYLYYRPLGSFDWQLIEGPLLNTGEYSWDTSRIADGQYEMLAEAVDEINNALAIDESEPFTVDNANAGVRISNVLITDSDTDSTKWVKDGDSVVVTAAITGVEASELTTDDITADLTSLGGEQSMTADIYDGFTATWALENVICSVSDGELQITVSIEEDSRTGTITADNTAPELTLEKPKAGLYLFNTRILPMSKTIIIGKCTILPDIIENGAIKSVTYTVDDVKTHTSVEEPYSWDLNIRSMRGSHQLQIKVQDGAGNTQQETLKFTLITPFGEDW